MKQNEKKEVRSIIRVDEHNRPAEFRMQLIESLGSYISKQDSQTLPNVVSGSSRAQNSFHCQNLYVAGAPLGALHSEYGGKTESSNASRSWNRCIGNSPCGK